MADCLTTIAAVGLHLASWHADPGFNNFNPGGFVRSSCEVLSGQPQAGVFYNSESSVSFYGALEFEYDREATFTPFLLAGAATGYDAFAVVPLVSVGGRVLVGNAGIALGFTPKVGDYGSNLFHIAVDWRF